MEHYDFLKEYPDAPWEVGVCDESGVDTKAYVFAKREYPKSFCVAEVREKYIGHALPTAQRIVACVNACAGIHTDTLSGGVVSELLQALDACVRELKDATEYGEKLLSERRSDHNAGRWDLAAREAEVILAKWNGWKVRL